MRIHDPFLPNPEKAMVDVLAMDRSSRLHGPGWCGGQTDPFEMRRPLDPRWSDPYRVGRRGEANSVPNSVEAKRIGRPKPGTASPSSGRDMRSASPRCNT